MESTDLRDLRGRLARLVAAMLLGVAATIGIMAWVISVSKAPNKDPIGASAVGLVTICVFVGATWLALMVLTRVQARLLRRGAPSA